MKDDFDKIVGDTNSYKKLTPEEIKELPRYSNGKIKGYTKKYVDKLYIRKRAYDLYASGYLTHEINTILQEEFGLKQKSVYNYTKEVREEFIRNHEEEINELRIRIIAMLWNDIRNSKNYWEKSDAIKNLMKLTGLGSENINIKGDHVINTYEISIKKDNKLEGGDK